MDFYKLKGQSPIFSEAEEEAMAYWLCEMSQRGISLRMCEILDFVQSVVKKEKRQTPFKGGRQGKKWYYSFMKRNSPIISSRIEIKSEMRSFKSNENIHKEGGSYYVVSANKASSVTLQSPGNESQRKHRAILRISNRQSIQRLI